MSLNEAQSNRTYGETVWLESAVDIEKGDNFDIKIGRVINVDTRWDGPGWKLFGETVDGYSVSIENPWQRETRSGEVRKLHFLIFKLLRSLGHEPGASDICDDPDAEYPNLFDDIVTNMVRDHWVEITAYSSKRVNGKQYVNWNLGGATGRRRPANKAATAAPATAPIPSVDDIPDDDIPW